ncbi:serine/threonine-protein kinase [Actinoplanes sp. NPDC051411]|uniref:serine/threonine-protein kinase n=1 Tax=Actinoplanes sp. NPDC051411 TaxID=3155522 RepID=UPI003437D657
MSTTDLPGSSLLASRYRLVERLGAGGMSVVWRGFDEVLGRQVAVKVLPPSTSTDPSFRRRLRAEAQAAARLSHPHITNVYDYGEATTVDGEPVPYVVMELIDGESLAAVLARVRRLPWQAVVRITSEVAAALAAAHARGIVHRDVTPANVMLTPSGAKVVDFGISALIGENDIDPDGSLLGTPAYLAPERLEGGQVSPATDVYAVGLLIYRTLIGQLPWDVGTTTALLRAHQYVEPDPLPAVEGLPDSVSALVGRCLEKRPSDRPSSAELAHVLAGIAAGAPAPARGYAADWSSESAEDTTILPSARSWTDRFGRPDAPAAPISPAPAPAAEDQSGPLAGAAARNSRFAALRSGPEINTPSAEGNPGLRPAYDNQPPAGAGPGGPPRSGGGDSGDTGNSRNGRYRNQHTRRVLFVAAAVAALTVGTYAWSLAADKNPNTSSPNAQPSVVPVSGKCVVSYAVYTDTQGRFSAQVTVANRADSAVKDWSLWFLMPGDQTVSGRVLNDVHLTQDAHQVTVTSATTLDPQKTLTMPITGNYVLNNAAPMAFKLNGDTCETFVSPKPGAPSQQVEHLSNGTVRLAPTPVSSSSTPVPGISVDPKGIVHIKPTTAPPNDGPHTQPNGGSTSTSASASPSDPADGNGGDGGEGDPVVPDPADPTTAPTTDPTTAPTTDPTSGPPSHDVNCDPAFEDCPTP